MNLALTENKIELSGHYINYVQAGLGRPMIFLHNGGGFWQSWIKQIQHFSKNYCVYGIDWPGFGESSELQEPLSLKLLTTILNDFIEFKNLKKVILIGNCIGGSAALNYTLHQPENVQNLIIFNICPGRDIYGNRVISNIIEGMNKHRRTKRIASRILKFIFLKTSVKKKFPSILFKKKISSNDYLFQKYVEKFKEEKQTQSRINMFFSVHTFTVEEMLFGQNMPNHLLVWGELNQVASLKRHGYKYKKILNSNRFELVQDSGHLCMYEQPDRVNEIIESELAR